MQDNFSIEEAKKAIRFLPSVPKEFEWKKLLWSLRSHFSERETMDIALSHWRDVKPNETEKEISRFDSSKGLTIATFIHEAQQKGYEKPIIEAKHSRKPKKTVEKWSLRYISNSVNRFLAINPNESSLRNVNDDDIKEIKRVLGKSFSLESFDKSGAKICISPYGIAFPPKVEPIRTIETDETLWIEGKTGLLTALSLGIDNHFNIGYRHNVSSKVQSFTKINYAMLDNDDLDQFKTSIILKEGQTLFEVRPPVDGKKDFADWIIESGVSAAEVVEFIHKNKIELIESLDKICSQYPMSDKGNAQRLIARYKDIIKYNVTNGTWYIWDGKKWNPDYENEIQEKSKSLTDFIKEEANYLSENEAKKRLSWAVRSGNRALITNAHVIASSNNQIRVRADHFDKENHLLNLRNGVFNLETFEFTEHKQEYKFSKMIDVDYNPNAVAKNYENFLHTIFDSDFEVINFVKRCLGISLSGEIYEEVVFFGYGKGKNGKSIFREMNAKIFGDYAVVGSNDLIIKRQNSSDNNTHKAKLLGKRLVQFPELPENSFLNEASVKEISGGDTLNGRFLYQNEFDFKPTHTTWIYGNHKPNIHGTDEGIWRRIVLIPFTVTIPAEKRIPKAEFIKTLETETELSGILNFMIAGFKDYKKNGLQPPETVINAVNEYKQEQDKVSEFLAEKCEVSALYEVKCTALYSKYAVFCESKQEAPYKKAKFYNAILDTSDNKIKKEVRRKEYWFLGINLIENLAQQKMVS